MTDPKQSSQEGGNDAVVKSSNKSKQDKQSDIYMRKVKEMGQNKQT